jgi:hypothetical protein
MVDLELVVYEDPAETPGTSSQDPTASEHMRGNGASNMPTVEQVQGGESEAGASAKSCGKMNKSQRRVANSISAPVAKRARVSTKKGKQ